MSALEILGWPSRCLQEICNSQLLRRSATVRALYQKVAACGQDPGSPPLSIDKKRALITSAVLDIFVGLAAGGVILRHWGWLQALVAEASERLMVGVLGQGTEWLMSVAPAGLKLNEELDMFMGQAVLRFLQVISGFVAPHRALLLSTALWSLLLSSPLGFSTLLALACDLLALATCHVSLLHWLSAAVYSAQLRSLAALWRLFRGRKRNPLRRRVDSSECHVEQIVVGSLAFTPLLLLLPTTWAYYALFAAAYSGTAAARGALQIVGAAVRSFPLYRLAAWAAAPGAFRSDVSFQVTSAEQEAGEKRPDRAGDGKSEASGKVSKRGAEVGARAGESVGDMRVTSAGRSEGAISGRPRAKECNTGPGERTDRKMWDDQEGWGDDRKMAMHTDGLDGARSPEGSQAEAKVVGALSAAELAARHLRLELVTADAVDVLRPFLRHLISPFSLVGAAGVVVALCVGDRVDPVLTFDDVEV